MSRIVVALTLLFVIATLLHFAFISPRRPLATTEPRARATDARGPWALLWMRWLGLFFFLILALTGMGFILTYGTWREGLFSSHLAVQFHVAAGVVFGAAVVLLGIAWFFASMKSNGRQRWLALSTGLLWGNPYREGRAAWLWFDVVLFWALAITGATLALRLEQWPFWLSLAYALHGTAALVAMLRLALYLYFWRLPDPRS